MTFTLTVLDSGISDPVMYIFFTRIKRKENIQQQKRLEGIDWQVLQLQSIE